MHMPKTLCREFVLNSEKGGNRRELLHIYDNRKRAYHIEIKDEVDKLILVPIALWSDEEKIPVISFDFT